MKSDAFRFGFVMSEANEHIRTRDLQGWQQLTVNQYNIHIHPEIDYIKTESEFGTAIIIGDVFVCHGDMSVSQIALSMIKEDAWDQFDNLTGKFAFILFSNTNGTKIISDPFGSRSIYYQNNGSFGVASHSSLLASVFNIKIDEETQSFRMLPEYKMRGTGYLPGDATMYENIKGLIPNNYYDVENRTTVRFWPRRPIQSITMEQFLKVCDEYFQRFSQYIRKYNLILGLTGGVDTRAVIAGLKENGCNMELVTWNPTRLNDAEKEVIDELVTYLGYQHEYFDATRRKHTDEYMNLAKATNRSSGFSRGPSHISVHLSDLVKDNDVFIRGWGGEIIRGFYNRHKTPMTDNLLKDFSRLYMTKRVKEPGEQFEQFVIDSTAGYIQRGNYSNNLYNVDVRDLFYWEHRMGMWGANVVNEMDPAVYNVIGLNSRPLYEASFGLLAEERLGSQIMMTITGRYDELLARIGVVS